MKNYLEIFKKFNEIFVYMVSFFMRNKYVKICLVNKIVIFFLDIIGEIKQFIFFLDMYWLNEKGIRNFKRDEQIEKFVIC